MARFVTLRQALPAMLLAVALGCAPAPTPGSSPSPMPTPTATPTAAAASTTPASPSASPSRPQPMLEKSTIQSRGENPWRLDAERIEYDDGRKTARVGILTWTLLDKDGKTLVEVEGNGAHVDLEAEKVSFEGPVVARGPRGEVLNVTDLMWDGKARKFIGTEGVKMEREGTVLTGMRLTASPDLKKLQVEGNVKVRMANDPLAGASPR